MPELLKLEGVHTLIGSYHILQGVDFAVEERRVTVLMGRNGAGKTTTMRTIMALNPASKGSIRLGGEPIEHLKTDEIARRGVAYVPENMGIFTGLSVRENMMLAARSGQFDSGRLDWIFEIFPALKTLWNRSAGNLSGGQRQMLAIARAVIEPRRLLLIDEPSKGLAPIMVDSLIAALQQLRDTTTILLIEQNLRLANAVGDDVYVIEDGRIVHRGSMEEFSCDAEAQRKYLSLGSAEL